MVIPESATASGNPAFNLKDAEPVAMGAVTLEDLHLEAELQRQHRDEAPTIPIEADPTPRASRGHSESRLLSDEVEHVRPAKTIGELQEQVTWAAQYDCDSVEATEALVKSVARRGWEETRVVGYITYAGIKVFIEGRFFEADKRDKETAEQRLFSPQRTALGQEVK